MDWRESSSDRMFSAMATAASAFLPLAKVLPGVHPAIGLPKEERVVSVPALDPILPGGGLPRAAVVELAAPRALGQASSLALHACAAAQRQARTRGGESAWCAWLDSPKSLYAPGVAAHGVTLERLLVVQPSPHAIARIAARMVLSRVFSVLVVDTLGVPGSNFDLNLHRWHNVVRRLAMAAREGDTSVILLTERQRARAIVLPVAMRLEIEQPQPGRLRATVAKERRGRITTARDLAYTRASDPEMARSA